MINIPGYLVEEKIRIALDHLLPKQREAMASSRNS